ncbi:MAG: aminomethyltransferase family protein [Acidobacteriota bacterium]
MPIPSPFHERTQPLCVSYRWKDWAGYYAVCSYDHCHEAEYYAIRHSAGLIDVTPLYKYDLRGPDAGALLSRMMVKDIGKLKKGRVTYCCWCDDAGKVIDDGTVSRLDETFYRVTAADPTDHWLARLSRGYDVRIEDSSASIAVVAVQGPTSRDILRQCSDADLDRLKFFGVTRSTLDGLDVWISRTGYSGDLGYEVWVENRGALRLWDALIQAGRPYGLLPAGLDAVDMARIEAGFIMLGVDYYSAPRVVLESRKSSPYEIGLGWTVHLDRGAFIGQAALQDEKVNGSDWKLVGLELDWEEIEALYEGYGLPPNLPAQACREPLPVHYNRRQVGRATSHTWSPILKKSIALASVRAPFANSGTRLQIEHTVEFERRSVSARVVPTPFFNPERKRKP